MRTIQKVIISIYLAVIATACLYVPWIYQFKLMGYAFIGHPLMGSYETWHYASLESWVKIKDITLIPYLIDYKRIILELIIITAVFTILFVLTLRPKVSRQSQKLPSQLI